MTGDTRRHEIELLANQVIARVRSGQPAEDDTLVELKTEWPKDPSRAARRIAAHANSARGERVVWLLGVDEKSRSVPGVPVTEPAQWWEQVRSHFEYRWSPGMQMVIVPHDAVAVVALVFDTTGAPFVIKNKAEFEVPWREGTLTRSARRAEILQILSPMARRPDYELRRGSLQYQVFDREFEPLHFVLELTIYVTPANDRTLVLPYHRMKAAVFSQSEKEIFEFDTFVGVNTDTEIAFHSGHVRVTSSEAILTGPGQLVLRAEGSGDWIETGDIEQSCQLRFLIRPAGDVAATKIVHPFARIRTETPNQATWVATFGAVSLLPRPSGL